MTALRLRLARAWCRWRGHRPSQDVGGQYAGRFIRALICPRCHVVFASEVGPRKIRRRAWRDRMRSAA